MIEVVRPTWPAPQNITAFTTTRIGGHSRGPYASFNLGLSVGDDEPCVRANRQLLKDYLQLPGEPYWIKQVHGNHVVTATQHSDLPSADASHTMEKNVICTVMTADCLPVLLCHREGLEVAAIHGGWRSLAQEIIPKTIQQMQSKPEELIAWLGPAIGPTAFEVGLEVKQAFVEKHPQTEHAFQSTDQHHALANIYLLAEYYLKTAGVHAVYREDYCTLTDDIHFFSHRRDGGTTGRMASFIWISQP